MVKNNKQSLAANATKGMNPVVAGAIGAAVGAAVGIAAVELSDEKKREKLHDKMENLTTAAVGKIEVVKEVIEKKPKKS